MRTVVLDTETNGLENYDKLWTAIFIDEETDERFAFDNVHEDPRPLSEFLRTCGTFIGHNLLFDLEVIEHFTGVSLWHLAATDNLVDTLVISRLLNYNQPGGHSLEAYGHRFGDNKSQFDDFSKWSQELKDRCIQDTLLTQRLYRYLKVFLRDPKWIPSIHLETYTTLVICRNLKVAGFKFDIDQAKKLRDELQAKVDELFNSFAIAFPPKPKPIRTITPSLTKKGTLNVKDFRWYEGNDLSVFKPEQPFTLFEWVPFNPSSPSQIVERLNEAGWKPTDKTKGHIEAIRKRDKKALEEYRVSGWRVSPENLETLPETAPKAAKDLSTFILLKSRLDDLKEWIGLYNERTGRIHGNFNAIGSWTGRKSHSSPNMANIPALYNRKGAIQPYGAEFRSLWMVPRNKVLVGCDAEGIQLRLFAHYTEDPRLIAAIETGKKEDKTDIHSLNLAILSPICKSREVAKTYIYALLLGAGTAKQAEILSCSLSEAAECFDKIVEFYPGWKEFLRRIEREDVQRGYFIGLDQRQVFFPSAHKILAGYLQNGESVVMKKACIFWHNVLSKTRVPYLQVNDVHDEWQTETLKEYGDVVGSVQAESLPIIGQELGLKCKLAGKYIIGNNWKETH